MTYIICQNNLSHKVCADIHAKQLYFEENETTI